MSKLFNQQAFVENGQFSGGQSVTLTSGATFLNASGSFGGLYVGEVGSLVVKTVDGSILTFVSASGFIPGLIAAVSSSSTAGSIIALK
jgi:hypothetical protein